MTGFSSRTCTSCEAVDCALRMPNITGRSAVTTIFAGPLFRSGMASRPMVRVTRTRSAPSCLISPDAGWASDTSGVCLPFCSNDDLEIATASRPGAVTATSSGVDWPTYFVGLAISMAGPGQAPGVDEQAAGDEDDDEDQAEEIAHTSMMNRAGTVRLDMGPWLTIAAALDRIGSSSQP